MKRTRFLFTMLLTIGIFVAGIAAGFSLTRRMPDSDAHAHDHDDHDDDEHALHASDPEVVELTEQSFRNLEMKLGNAALGDHTRTIRIPARVIELPGHSDHQLAAPVDGIVERVFVRTGQSISVGDPVFTLRVTDENLLNAQLKLLDVITKLEVNAADTERLTPLAEVRGRQLVDLKYQRKQLAANERLYRQELLVRGLSEEQIKSIVDDKTLVREITLRMPNRLHARNRNATVDHEDAQGRSFTIEKLDAVPGTTVSRGDDLCHLAYHAALYIEGQAFEKDLPLLERMHAEELPFSIEFGAGDGLYKRENVAIEYVDNQIDQLGQTYSFYAPIHNEIVSEKNIAPNMWFRTWRLKPGQRAHVVLPVEQLTGHIKLPAEAVVEEGPDAFVFRRYVTPHVHDPDDHDHVDPYVEFKRTPVHLIYRDRDIALIANDKQIEVGQRIAINNAFDLNLIVKTNAGGGVDPHAGHSH